MGFVLGGLLGRGGAPSVVVVEVVVGWGAGWGPVGGAVLSWAILGF